MGRRRLVELLAIKRGGEGRAALESVRGRFK
jgi:hypothetical protein